MAIHMHVSREALTWWEQGEKNRAENLQGLMHIMPEARERKRQRGKKEKNLANQE